MEIYTDSDWIKFKYLAVNEIWRMTNTKKAHLAERYFGYKLRLWFNRKTGCKDLSPIGVLTHLNIVYSQFNKEAIFDNILKTYKLNINDFK